MHVARSYCRPGGFVDKRKTNQPEQFKIEDSAGAQRNWQFNNWNVQRMFYLCKLVFTAFFLSHGGGGGKIGHLSRAICSPAPSPSRHIGPWGSGSRIGNGVVSPDAAWSRPASWWWLVMSPPANLSGRPYFLLFLLSYKSRRVHHLGLSCQVAGGGVVLNGEPVVDLAKSHVPSHWDSQVDLLQHFNYSADLPSCGIASCRSSPTIMGNSVG